jgi:multiple sugar transport system substrate-binding protein
MRSSIGRNAAAVAATVAAVVAIAGCGSSSAPDTTAGAKADSGTVKQLTVWHYWDGKNADTFSSLVGQYEKAHPGLSIKVVNVPGSDIQTKLQAATASRTLPDIEIGDLVNVPKLAQTGRLVDLKSVVPASTWSDMYPSMLSFGSQGANQLSIPVSANDLALLYNVDLMIKAGLDPARPPTTWEELTAASATIRAKTGKPGFELFTQAGDNGEGLTWNFQISLWQAGGEFLNKDNTKAAFNTPQGKKALTYWTSLVKAKASPLGPWGAFEKGNAVSAQEGSWMVGIWAADPPFNFAAAQIPPPVGGQAATNLGGEQAVVFKSDGARQKAAADFLTWFDAPAQSLAWSEATGFLPVRKSVAEGSDYTGWVTKTAPRMKPFVDALPSAHARPNTPLYADASLAFAKQIERALYGKATVGEALAAAENDVNANLAAG